MKKFKLGLKPHRPGAVKMKFGDYLTPALPKCPATFGHENLVKFFHMLGNDRFGNCAWAGAAHEQYIWSSMGSTRTHITTMDVLSDYSACTGFRIGDETTDQGTDMQMAASYRRKVGIRDINNIRHKITAYAEVKAGDLEQILTAAWLFGCCALGVTVGANQEEQFSLGRPWDGAPGSNAGGHYVPLVGFRDGLAWVVTWGELQPVTPDFIRANCDQAMAYLSPEMLKNGKSLEGFDLAALTADLSSLTS